MMTRSHFSQLPDSPAHVARCASRISSALGIGSTLVLCSVTRPAGGARSASLLDDLGRCCELVELEAIAVLWTRLLPRVRLIRLKSRVSRVRPRHGSRGRRCAG